jgi:hypothetical protein
VINRTVSEGTAEKDGKMDKRTFLSRLHFVLLTCLLILPCSKDASGAKWIFVGKTDASWYYDAKMIDFLPNSIIQVWVKIIPNDADTRLKHIEVIQKKPLGLSIHPNNNACAYAYTLELTEVDCKYKTLHMLTATDHSNKGEVVYSYRLAKSEPEYITPNSIGAELDKAVCSLNNSKKKRR